MQQRVLNGRYELIGPLGQGGMATVYRGRDLRLGRAVAIKILHNYYAADDEFLQRFAHEAMSAASLSSHPNIVDVYDVGQDGDINYIVMELVEGQDLKAMIDAEAPISPDTALQIIEQAAEGLDYAHRRGLIHRDVKPQNILITPNGQIRITDFGIAKSHLSTAVTQAGMTFGTADYISPEQAQGLAATPQSDIYSLGMVLFEMLTGRLPFVADTPMAVALQHIQNAPPSLRQFNPSLPPTLDALVLRAIAKDPGQRPGSAAQFAQELRDFRSGRMQQTVAVPVNPAPRQPVQRTAQPTPRRLDPDATMVNPAPQQRRQAQRPQYAPPPPPTMAPPRERGGSFGTLLIGLLLLGGVLTLAWFAFNTDWSDFFPATGGPPPAVTSVAGTATPEPTATAQPTGTAVQTIALPNFVGQSERVVVEQLNQLGLVRRANPDDTTLAPRFDPAPAGTVIVQDPPQGTEVPVGSEITIIVSLGPEVVEVPNVVQRPAQDAQSALEAAGFVVQLQPQPSINVQEGFVISQNPQAGARLNRGATITLAISAGDVVAFPDVVANGTLLDDAQRQITSAGFRVAAVDEQGPDRLPNFNSFQPNEVVSATADGIPIDAPGKLVPRGATVVLGVRAP
ncbi:MAG TPA: Stk1 family PASTA domain-containing Ser/Thr kinase [Herpetosiphonaceae bacterium]